MPQIVQFLHPGREHGPGKGKSNHKAWIPRGSDHGRKYLLSAGSYVAVDGSVTPGTLEFWGEWEPPSYFESLNVPSLGHPQRRHKPYLPAAGQGVTDGLNTDPLVFGASFIYALCRQAKSPALRNLDIGSLVLFGSLKNLGGVPSFQLDTVFVVGSKRPYSMNPPDFGGCLAGNPCQKRLVLDAGCDSAVTPQDTLTCYQGATPASPAGGMYSFAPSRVSTGLSEGFPRPTVPPSDYVNPRLGRNFRITRKVHPDEILRLWDSIRTVVQHAGLVAGVHFAEPGPKPL